MAAKRKPRVVSSTHKGRIDRLEKTIDKLATHLLGVAEKVDEWTARSAKLHLLYSRAFAPRWRDRRQARRAIREVWTKLQAAASATTKKKD